MYVAVGDYELRWFASCGRWKFPNNEYGSYRFEVTESAFNQGRPAQ
jgi:hypothetical protein